MESGLYAFRDDQSQVDEGMDTLMEEQDLTNHLSKTTVKNIQLFHCHNYECRETNGFIKYHDIEENQIKVAECSPKCHPDYIAYDCRSGNAYYSKKDSKFNICVSNGGSKNLIPKEIENQQFNYIFNNTLTSSNAYNLYITNKGGNIIGLSLFESIHFADIDSNGENVVVLCNGGDVNDGNICRKTNKPGYYLSGSGNDEKTLVFCDEDRVCDEAEVINGYFINSLYTEVIRCYNDRCKHVRIGTSTCTDNEHTVIRKDDNHLVYCSGE